MRKYFILLIIIFGLISCNEFKERLSDKIELRQLESSVSSTKTSSAWFVITAGSYDQSETSIPIVKVFGKIDGTYRLIEFPLKNARINIDNSIKTPTIQIGYTYHRNLRNTEILRNSEYNADYYIINCPDIYLPEKLIPITIK